MKRFMLGITAITLAVSGYSSTKPKIEQSLVSANELIESAQESEPSFSDLNPHYKDRVGVFYDIRYVSPSAESLFKVADIKPDQMRQTLKILRLFVDERLDVYIENEGAITQSQVNQCIQQMDTRFKSLLNDLQFKQYCIWRDDEAGKYNQLRFLMAPSLKPNIQAELKRVQQGAPNHTSEPFLQIELTKKTEAACAEAIENMMLSWDVSKADPAITMADAQRLVLSYIPIAQTISPRSCVEYKGWFLISRLNTGNEDDGTFKSGIAVKKGSTKVYKWK